MKRDDFLKKGAIGLGAIIAIPTAFSSCKKDNVDPDACAVSPDETAGPFPIKTPADWIRENIVGNRTGIPLMINIVVQNTNDNCAALGGVSVDIWQCDAQGNYSEYAGQLDGDFTSEHFLRGRQTTNASGTATFVSLYPGWYPGRAPHLHLEILSGSGSSLLTTQIGFPEDVSQAVYATSNYKGDADTSNNSDGAFSDSLARNLADSVTGNVTDGYTLTKVIKVAG